MSQTSDMTVTLCNIGLSDTEKVILRVASGILKEQRCIQAIQEDDRQTAQLALIDLDSEEGKQYYESEARQNKKQQLILLCQNALNTKSPRDIVLTKPLRVQVLVDIVEELLKTPPKKTPGLSLSGASSPPAPAATAPQEVPPSDAPSLFLTLLKAQESKQAMQIFYSGRKILFINPQSGILASGSPPQSIMALTREQDSIRIQSVPISQEDFELLAKGHILTPLNDVLWNAAIFGSRGRLVQALRADMPVKLMAWPNLTRVDFRPEHMQLAALLGKQAQTLQQLQARTQFAEAELIAFLNAAWSIQLLDTRAELVAAASSPAPSTAPQKQSGLLAKIARRLNIKSSN